MGRLSSRTILAVGCGSPDGKTNNGLAAARAFLVEGADVCIVDKNPEALDHAAEVLNSENHPGRLLTVGADVTDEDSMRTAVSACIDEFGNPNVLYYNVGVVINGGLQDLDPAKFRLALDINLTGAFIAMRTVIDPMLEAGSGSIITVSSIGGLRYMGYDYPAYAASKAGLEELTKVTGLRYADKGIRANSIAPGLIETPLIHTSISGHYASAEEMLAERHALSPTGSMGTPEDVADAAVFLASEASAYINATTIPVDGGLIHRAAQ